jgi:beta-galactosidase
MIFLKNFVVILLFFLVQNLSAAVKITPLSHDFPKLYEGRKIIELTDSWDVYSPRSADSRTNVILPASFYGTDELVFEKTISFTSSDISDYNIFLVIDGIDHSAEFFINDQSFYKFPYGQIPLTVLLPSELLIENQKNSLKIKINSALGSETTIPTKQRFLFPENRGGISGNVYLKFVPKNGIVSVAKSVNFEKNFSRVNLNFVVSCSGTESKKGNRKVSLTLLSDSSLVLFSKSVKPNNGKANFSVILKNPNLYSPSDAKYYRVKVELKSDEKIIDVYYQNLPLFNLVKTKNRFLLNGENFNFKGVEYTPFSKLSNELFSYKRIEEDFEIAKSLGFNTIRFSHNLPNNAIMELLLKHGLFAFVEVPDNFIPDALLNDSNFKRRLSEYVKNFISFYENYPNVIALGAGSSFLPDSEPVFSYLSDFANKVKSSGKLSYATFVTIPSNFDVVDFAGIESESRLPEAGVLRKLDENSRGKLFISGTYPAFEETRQGYLYENSYEAQGKYFRELLKLYDKLHLNGFFINSLIDFSGDYSSLYASYSKNKLYKIGILGTERLPGRIAYKVISEKLNHNKNVSIPIGNTIPQVPLFFIVLPLFLAVLIGGILNSRRKFREDAKRALFRSYNFFADIRDQRLLSGFHSYFMMVISSATLALLGVNVMFFLRGNISLEKILLSFGSFSFVTDFSYLAWHPKNAFMFLWIAIMLGIILISLLVKFFSVFNRTRVLYENIFYSITWAIMPVTLLLVVELLFLKILYLNSFNFLIYFFVVIFLIWLFFRVLKGIYIVFDVQPSTVYLFAFGILVLFIGGFLLYYQISANVFDYLSSAMAQVKYF